MTKKFHIVYITTNLVNGKQYVGDHSTNNLNDNYLGSGIYFLHALKEYGKRNFKKEILEEFESKEQAFNAQEKYIQKYNTLNPKGYNISPKGGHNVKDCISKESKLKMSLAKKGKSYLANNFGDRKRENNGMFGKKHTPGKFLGKNNSMYRKTVYSTWKEKYGKEIADKKFYNFIEKCKKSSKNRKKIKCPYCSKLAAVNTYARWHGNNCKFIKLNHLLNI